MCLSTGANLWTGTSRRLTEGTSGLSGIFVTNQRVGRLSVTVACENGKHHVVSTMLKELHAPTHREVYKELLRRNEAKVCAQQLF